MSTLFDIGSELLALHEKIDLNEGELPVELEAWFNNLAESEGEKLHNYCQLIDMLQMEADAANLQAQAWLEKRQRRLDKIQWLKDQLILHLQRTNRTKAYTSCGESVAIRKAGGQQRLVVDDTRVDPRFLRRRVVTEVDRSAIRAALDSGEQLDFAEYAPRSLHLLITK